jgi:hypothetical protein
VVCLTGSHRHDWLKTGLLGAALFSVVAGACGARTGLDPGLTSDAGATPDATVPEICPDRRVSKLRLGAVTQMDMLFVVDSSASMADKQELLKDAVPPLVSRLVNPWCLDAVTGTSVAVGSPAEECPAGYAREFKPLEDLHIGVITTSLGSHGGQVCQFETADLVSDDHARLLPSVRAGLASYQGLGFLAWDPEAEQEPPGQSDSLQLEADFLSHVSAVGDNGCGYEAPLEAFYRFLVDPEPPLEVVYGSCPSGTEGCSERVGIDQIVLEQRKAFLRPDSVVAILMLSDENDCSIVDEGQGWLVGQIQQAGGVLHLPRATSTCAVAPNDVCCQSCAVSSSIRPAGCPPIADDPECKRGALSEGEDSLNLRCFDQKRRFGFDLLYPVARYVNALREPTICPRSEYRDLDCSCRLAREQALAHGLPEPPCTSAQTGTPVANPLYSNLSSQAAFARDASQVFLAGIVGIPWQDLATPETLADPTRLDYLTAQELHASDPATGVSRWDALLGNPELGIAGDPFLLESVGPRSGTNPITRAPVVAPQPDNPLATINGHEFSNPTGNTLQHTCIFPLEATRDCSTGGGGLDCDCDPEDFDFTNALCQPTEGVGVAYQQYFAKAYPSRRLLELLRDYGENSITSSICPKFASGDGADLALGYRPAVASLVQRFRCASLDAEFETDPGSANFGQVPCTVLAVSDEPACSCDSPGRSNASGDARDHVLGLLEQQGSCGGATGVPCESYCMCELAQLSQGALDVCQSETTPPGSGALSGWCYVDPTVGFGTSEVVASCPVGHERNVRALGGATPREGETLYSVCIPACAND